MRSRRSGESKGKQSSAVTNYFTPLGCVIHFMIWKLFLVALILNAVSAGTEQSPVSRATYNAGKFKLLRTGNNKMAA